MRHDREPTTIRTAHLLCVADERYTEARDEAEVYREAYKAQRALAREYKRQLAEARWCLEQAVQEEME